MIEKLQRNNFFINSHKFSINSPGSGNLSVILPVISPISNYREFNISSSNIPSGELRKLSNFNQKSVSTTIQPPFNYKIGTDTFVSKKVSDPICDRILADLWFQSILVVGSNKYRRSDVVAFR